MKAADKDKRIHTIPKGAWESGMINDKENRSPKQQLNDITTDIQGNGYPISVRTTGLAGSLLCPYKGLLPTCARKAH